MWTTIPLMIAFVFKDSPLSVNTLISLFIAAFSFQTCVVLHFEHVCVLSLSSMLKIYAHFWHILDDGTNLPASIMFFEPDSTKVFSIAKKEGHSDLNCGFKTLDSLSSKNRIHWFSRWRWRVSLCVFIHRLYQTVMSETGAIICALFFDCSMTRSKDFCVRWMGIRFLQWLSENTSITEEYVECFHNWALSFSSSV